MKPFDIEKAKAGANVCTRDGRPARIVCWDKMGDFPILALVLEKSDREVVSSYTPQGKYHLSDNRDSDLDLFLAPTKREGWVNIYRDINGNLRAGFVYASKKKAEGVWEGSPTTIAHIEWEEY